MRDIVFDEVIHKEFNDTVIDYGIVNGNNTIVFIKSGQDGSMCGYKNKYLRMANDINNKYGYTVICSSNPYNGVNPLDDAIEVINNYCSNKGYKDYEIYYMGHSCGGLIGLWYGVNYPHIKRILSVNAPLMYNWHNTKYGIKRFKGDRLTLVYGSLDQSIKYTELAKLLESDIVKLEIVEGQDHHFSKNDDDFYNLPFEFLL